MDSALDTFIAEAHELVQAMESGLLRIGDGERNAETLNEIFRSAHTIKGSAGLFGFDEIVHFTHHVEKCFGPSARRRDRSRCRATARFIWMLRSYWRISSSCRK